MEEAEEEEADEEEADEEEEEDEVEEVGEEEDHDKDESNDNQQQDSDAAYVRGINLILILNSCNVARNQTYLIFFLFQTFRPM